VTEIRQIAPAPDDAPHRTPVAMYVAERDGVRIAQAELTRTRLPHHTAGHLLRFLRWDEGCLDAAFGVVAAAVRAAPGGSPVHLVVNTEAHEHIEDRRRLAVESGFGLLQEKEGVWWTDEGQPLPAVDRLTLRPLTEVGTEAFAAVFARCMTGTLDRIDREKVAEFGARGWAGIQLSHYVPDEDAPTWLLAEDTEGEAVGFVGLGAFDEEATGTIGHIGVIPEQRGRGYVHQLLRAVNLCARERGFRGVLSDVDVLNGPMLDAMARAGHRADGRPWHKWYYRTVA
jgi:GNAT superfamily N-acetyltransferase